VERSAATDPVRDTHGPRRFALIDVEHLSRIQNSEADSLPGEVAQPKHFGLCGTPQVELVPDAMRQFERARAEAVGLVARVDPHISLLDECLQDAMQGPLRKARLLQQLGEPGRRRCGRDRVDHCKTAKKGLHPGLSGSA
jgi:hypothetical protein